MTKIAIADNLADLLRKPYPLRFSIVTWLVLVLDVILIGYECKWEFVRFGRY